MRDRYLCCMGFACWRPFAVPRAAGSSAAQVFSGRFRHSCSHYGRFREVTVYRGERTRANS